jgi:hypothetical protein
MPAPTRAKNPPIEMLPREERIRRRAYELSWEVVLADIAEAEFVEVAVS